VWSAGAVGDPLAGSRPRAVDAGAGCGIASGALWLLSVMTNVPARLWADPSTGGYGHVGGLFAAFGVLMAVLSVVTWARSPQAWLLLQLFSVIAVVAALGGGWAIATSWSSLGSADRWLMPLCLLTGATQVAGVVLLNRRSSRRWCQVDPQGYRTVFWK
jgi:hypothetical protein